jgi:hypothetical protein
MADIGQRHRGDLALAGLVGGKIGRDLHAVDPEGAIAAHEGASSLVALHRGPRRRQDHALADLLQIPFQPHHPVGIDALQIGLDERAGDAGRDVVGRAGGGKDRMREAVQLSGSMRRHGDPALPSGPEGGGLSG